MVTCATVVIIVHRFPLGIISYHRAQHVPTLRTAILCITVQLIDTFYSFVQTSCTVQGAQDLQCLSELWTGLPLVTFDPLLSTHLHIMTAPFDTHLLVLFCRYGFFFIRKDQHRQNNCLSAITQTHSSIIFLSRLAIKEDKSLRMPC